MVFDAFDALKVGNWKRIAMTGCVPLNHTLVIEKASFDNTILKYSFTKADTKVTTFKTPGKLRVGLFLRTKTLYRTKH